jgi:hypothetical protein
MDLFTRQDLKALLAPSKTPCVSVYMPTHRGGGQEDPIRWKNHLADAEDRLITTGMRHPEAKDFLLAARQLTDDVSFWKYQCDGLAFFLAQGFMRVYRLPMPLEDLVVVAERFHVTPLLPLLSGNGRFFVLALSQNAVRLLHGSRYSVTEIGLKGIPHSLAEALLTHDSDEVLTFHGRRTSVGTWGAIFAGHGVGIDDAKDDILLYFQKIDRSLHGLLHAERRPLVLAAVDYLLPIYRQANTYPHLLKDGIKGNPDRLRSKELHDAAWSLVRPEFEAAEKQAAAQFRLLAGTGRTTSELSRALPAAYRGEVETLFITLGTQRWGRFDVASGQVTEHDQWQPGDEDLLNTAAIHTLLHGKTVYAVAPEQVPDGGPLAATFCLPLAKHGKRSRARSM